MINIQLSIMYSKRGWGDMQQRPLAGIKPRMLQLCNKCTNRNCVIKCINRAATHVGQDFFLENHWPGLPKRFRPIVAAHNAYRAFVGSSLTGAIVGIEGFRETG